MVVSLADARAWHAYIEEDLRVFHEREGDTARVWKLGTELEIARVERHIARANTYGAPFDEAAAYVGNWAQVRKLCTREFVQFIEESMVTERITLPEWVSRARADRAAEKQNADYEASGEPEMNALSDLADLMARRDELIYQAYVKGRGATEIARTVGLSRSQVHVIIIERDKASLAEVEEAEKEAVAASGHWIDWDDDNPF